MTTIKTPAQRTILRLKAAWADMSYAQRRLFDIRVGLPPEDSARDARIKQLEALYRLQAKEPRLQAPAR
jgi:hypothetical protein